MKSINLININIFGSNYKGASHDPMPYIFHECNSETPRLFHDNLKSSYNSKKQNSEQHYIFSVVDISFITLSMNFFCFSNNFTNFLLYGESG
jgi:hypothetical protein